VLCEIAAREGVVAKEWDGVGAFYGGEREFLPAAGRRWAGVDAWDPVLATAEQRHYAGLRREPDGRHVT